MRSLVRIERSHYQQFFSRFSSGIMTDSIAKAYFELFDFEFDGDLIIRAFIKFFIIAIMKGVRDLRSGIMFGDVWCLFL